MVVLRGLLAMYWDAVPAPPRSATAGAQGRGGRLLQSRRRDQPREKGLAQPSTSRPAWASARWNSSRVMYRGS